MRERLPADICDGPKIGFGVPYEEWLRTSLFEFARAAILAQTLHRAFRARSRPSRDRTGRASRASSRPRLPFVEATAAGALVPEVSVVTAARPRVLFVGAFPPPGAKVFGGMVTSCGALLQSSFPTRLDLDMLDSTQISNPPPGLAVRLLRAGRRCARFILPVRAAPTGCRAVVRCGRRLASWRRARWRGTRGCAACQW